MPRKKGRKSSNLQKDTIKKIDIPEQEPYDPFHLSWFGLQAPILKSGGVVTSKAMGLPQQQSMYAHYNEMTSYRDNMLRIIAENDSYLQTIYRILPNEIFKGKINLDKAYGSKCPLCDYTSDKDIEECPDCKEKLEDLAEKLGLNTEEVPTETEEENKPELAPNGGTAVLEQQNSEVLYFDEGYEEKEQDPKLMTEYDDLKQQLEDNPMIHPDESVKKELEVLFENLNDFGHSLEQVLKLADGFKHKIDNAAIMAFKTYVYEETERKNKLGYSGFFLKKSYVNRQQYDSHAQKVVNRFMALNPDAVQFNCEDNSDYIKEEYFCPSHRDKAVSRKDASYTGFCEQLEDNGERCGKELLRAYYYVEMADATTSIMKSMAKKYYYTQKEIKHYSFYNPTNTKGRSVVYTVLPLLETKFGIYIDLKMRYMDRQYPDEVMVITGSNEDAFAKQKEYMHHQIQIGELPTMYNEIRPGETAARDPVKLIKLREDSIAALLNKEVLEEIRNECLRLYGVEPLFAADVQRSSALSGEGQQIRVMSKTIEANQEQYHESIFPWIMECLEVDDWVLRLNPPEEETEAHQEQLKALKLDNMRRWVDLGVDVEIEDYENVEYTVKGNPKKTQSTGFGSFGEERNPFGSTEPGESDFGTTEEMELELMKEFELTDEDIEKAFEVDNYADMTIDLSQQINKEIRVGLRANAGFRDIVKNIEDLPDWSDWVIRQNPALDKQQALDNERYRIERIVRNEGTKVRKEKYVDNMRGRDPDNRFRYRWAGPTDVRITPICSRIMEAVDDRVGVTLPQLERIMKLALDAAIGAGEIDPRMRKYFDINSHQPHIGCRHVARRVS